MKQFGIGKWGGAGFVYAVLILGILAVVNCTQEIEPPQWGGGDGEEVHCILPVGTTCIFIDLADCRKNGGTPVESCPVTEQSSNSGGGNDSSNSGSGNDSSNSGGGNDSSNSGGGNDSSNSGGGNDSSNSGGGTSSSSGTTQSSGGTTQSSNSTPGSCGAYNSATHFCDERDGTVYKYEIAPVDRGGGHWMSENLNYSKDGTIGYCYGTGNTLGSVGANTANCNSPNGRNYTYDEAMAGNSSQGVCPSGWHIPTGTEWQIIGAVVSSSTSASGTRNMSNAFYVYSGNFNTNPGPSGTWALGWSSRGTGSSSYGFYWTSTADDYYIFISSIQVQIRTDAHAHGGLEYYSVRCLKDGTGTTAFSPPVSSPLTLNTWSSGTIASSSGEAWYSFNVSSGNTYYVWLDDADTKWNSSSYTFDGKYAAYYSNGTSIFDGNNPSTGRSFNAASSGTVYVKVSPYSGGTGAFSVGYTTTSTRPPSVSNSSSSGSSLPACQYQSSWCGGTSLANVKYNVPSPCIFIKGITGGGGWTLEPGMLVNGNAPLYFDNSYPKVDGGYYLYAGTGYSFNDPLPPGMITNTPQDCNANGS
jgi:uncharacterized protein (TIGR02145 family)